jgi:beta-N-acetylhexosaminidase
MSVCAAILGCSGPELTAEERAFFGRVQPWGFILFGRNVSGPDQVRTLVARLRETVGRDDAPVLIDQEGGRVQRLGPPHWRRFPPGRAYGDLARNDPLFRREITRLGARLLAHDLAGLGINVDCAPVLDVPDPAGHEVIGDRAYGASPDEVAALGRAAAEGLIAGGVLPVVKHIPGHGRARADSHEALPVVDAPLAELDARDFAPFKALSDMPMAMTAHVIYSAVDPRRPATVSRAVMRRVVRGAIGFGGLVMSDDLSMRALSGGFAERARAARAAGCDVVLHCNGSMAEMRAVSEGAGRLAGQSAARAKAALARLPNAPEPFDAAEGRARFDAAFEGRWAA